MNLKDIIENLTDLEYKELQVKFLSSVLDNFGFGELPQAYNEEMKKTNSYFFHNVKDIDTKSSSAYGHVLLDYLDKLIEEIKNTECIDFKNQTLCIVKNFSLLEYEYNVRMFANHFNLFLFPKTSFPISNYTGRSVFFYSFEEVISVPIHQPSIDLYGKIDVLFLILETLLLYGNTREIINKEKEKNGYKPQPYEMVITPYEVQDEFDLLCEELGKLDFDLI